MKSLYYERHYNHENPYEDNSRFMLDTPTVGANLLKLAQVLLKQIHQRFRIGS